LVSDPRLQEGRGLQGGEEMEMCSK
jgi:hypothetical protein